MAGRTLIFMGPPGSGKGTQAASMRDRLGLVPLSSGDTLRAEIKAGSDIGRQAAQYVQAGTLVPDEIITGVMLAAVKRQPAGAGVILDGFPRTVGQAEALEQGLADAGRRVDAVIDFQIDDSLIVDRIVNRRVCKNCGATYNIRFCPPQTADVCDRCGGTLIQRVDDREDVIRTRLATYREQTAPLIEYYAARGLLHRVDAAREATAVESDVAGLIEALG